MRFLAVMLQKKPDYLEQKRLSLQCCIQEKMLTVIISKVYFCLKRTSVLPLAVSRFLSGCWLTSVVGFMLLSENTQFPKIFGYECRELF